jgi:NitT/TauT family transport system substrate-binding protein
MIRAHERACRFITEQPEEALAIAVRYTGMPRGIVEQAMAHMRFNPAIDREKIGAFEAFLSELGYLVPARGQKQNLNIFSAD